MTIGAQTSLNILNSMVMYTCPTLPFLGKLGPKNQNCLFKMKVDTQINSIMLNSMVMFTFSVLDQIYPFWQIQSRKLKMKTLIDLNMLNSVVVFVCPVWNPFLANLVQKKLKLSVKDEIWYINKLKCAKFDDNVHSYLNHKFPF